MLREHKQLEQTPHYTTHPTVVAAASIVGITTSIGFFLAIGMILFGSRMEGNQPFALISIAFAMGYVFWWMMKTETAKRIEGPNK